MQPKLPSYQHTSQAASRPGIYSMAQNPYPPRQGYGSSATMMPQPTTPAPAGTRVGPPVLRPQPGVSWPYAQGPMMHQPSPVMHRQEQPTHVVGSQSRRGILPSAPGRPAAPGAGTKITAKDADGKFPCPHCTKTYLHAKHLKRHILRHTGDRPYMCVLCRDTFSRSDVLKRHFQKCSIRRGNPTGASHLPNADIKKNRDMALVAMNRMDNGASMVGSEIPSCVDSSLYDSSFSSSACAVGQLQQPLPRINTLDA
jgi:hypothetical protein